MNRFRAGLVALTLASLAFAPLAARAATESVSEQGTSFSPDQADVKVGDTVVWTYKSGPAGQGHSVTFDNGPDLSPACRRGLLGGTSGCQGDTGVSTTVQRTFTAPGTYTYRCKIHGSSGMVGVVVVTAAASTSSSLASTSSTLARATTTSTTARSSSTSSTTPTSRELSTSSTIVRSTTTTADSTSVLLPGDAPSFSGDDASSNAAGSSKDSGGNDSGTIALIVGLLVLVGGGGGFLLWRLRPGRT